MSHHAGAHAPIFVLLSIAVAILGSWAALEMFRQVRANTGRAAIRWIAATACAFGLSVWSMHFVAMLGWDPGVPVGYGLGLTALSLLLPIIASGFGFTVAVALRLKALGIALTAAIMGTAICAMHYVGMAAVTGPVRLSFDPATVAASYLVAAVASAGGLWAAQREVNLFWRATAATALGLAIVGMHYTGMAALSVTHTASGATTGPAIDNLMLAFWVTTSTLLLLAMAMISARFDRQSLDHASREADAALQSQALLRAILEQMPVGVLVAEAPSGAVRFGNAEAERILGHPVITVASKEEYGRYGTLLADGTPQPPERYALARSIRGERVSGERQIYRRGDGELINLEVFGGPIRNKAGEVELGIVAFQDVTAAVRAEDALRRTQQLEAIGQLTGGVAHDFNNLLTAVIGSVTMARKRVDDERVQALLQNALHGAERGAKLTAQLLAFSRRQRLETRPVDVNDMLRRMEGLLATTLGTAVSVRLDLRDGLPAAVADPTQLELAVLNLAINARDAMASGGRLEITTRDTTIHEAGDPNAPEPGRYVEVCVADDGSGMSPEILARAFEPFFTTKPVGKGSGLGLSQVLGLAKQMGGGLRVDTAPGQGTRMSIFLPEAETPAEETPTARGVGTATRRGEAAILVVDDDPDVRRYVADLLAEAGYAVTAAASGGEALDLVRAGSALDLALIDFAMPGLNGLETSERLRALKPDIPVVIMTGFANLDELPQALDREGLVQKPFEPDDLLARLDGMLAKA